MDNKLERIYEGIDLSKVEDMTSLHAWKILDYQQQIENLTAKMEYLKDIIKHQMGEDELLTLEDYIVRYTKIESDRFAVKEFKEVHPKMYKAFLRTSSSRRFTITENKENKIE